jgi:AcrR family transcriptional regulator
MFYGGMMKRISKAQRHDQLIDVAIKVFAEKGYQGATTSAIGKEAKVSEKLLYMHFKNKKDLFLKCLDKVSNDIRRGFLEASADQGNDGFTEKIGMFFYDYMTKHAHAISLLAVHAGDLSDSDIKNVYRELFKRNVDIMDSYTQAGMKSGKINSKLKLNPRALAWIFVGGYYTTLLMRDLGFDEFNRRFINDMLDVRKAIWSDSEPSSPSRISTK